MALLQIYKQTSEKYQACLNIFHSECRIYSREAQIRQTNERKISSLLEYFLQRVQRTKLFNCPALKRDEKIGTIFGGS